MSVEDEITSEPKRLGSKTANSQAAWALLTEGVTRARIESHRLQHLMERAIKLAEASESKEQIYQAAGDIIVGMPERLELLQQALDRTSLALAKMGQEYLESRLSLSDKTMVEEATQAAFGVNQHRHSTARVVDRFLQRRLVQDNDE